VAMYVTSEYEHGGAIWKETGARKGQGTGKWLGKIGKKNP